MNEQYIETLDLLREIANEYCVIQSDCNCKTHRCLLWDCSTEKCMLLQTEIYIKEIKAIIEKQTEIEPDLSGDGYGDDGELIYDTWTCPTCNTDYEVDYDIYKHCPNCGQKLKTDKMRA